MRILNFSIEEECLRKAPLRHTWVRALLNWGAWALSDGHPLHTLLTPQKAHFQSQVQSLEISQVFWPRQMLTTIFFLSVVAVNDGYLQKENKVALDLQLSLVGYELNISTCPEINSII